jgi:uncharacterized membrane protein
MNIHPAIVHFPIALLAIYALCELIRSKSLKDSFSWFAVKTTLVVVGFLGALASLSTGEIAEEAYTESQLIEVHSNFAVATTWVFGIIALVYFLLFIYKHFGEKINAKLGVNLAGRFEKVMLVTTKAQQSLLMPILALVGLITLTITGGLGGAIVYGQNADPIVSFIYSLFF